MMSERQIAREYFKKSNLTYDEYELMEQYKNKVERQIKRIEEEK